jgi:hypothetical protein
VCCATRPTQPRQQGTGDTDSCAPRRRRNLDDCWLTKDRDTNGDLQVDKRAFPDGLEPVIRHVHSKGLKFGLVCSLLFFLFHPPSLIPKLLYI